MPTFEEQVLEMRPKLLNIARKLTAARKEDSEDLVQQTMLIAFRSRNSFVADENLGGWLYRILLNKYINWKASKKRHGELTAQADEIHDIFEGEIDIESSIIDFNTPEFLLERKELMARIEEAISLLDPKFKKVAIMRFLDDADYDEIAKEVHIKVGTVKSRVYRARRDLKPLLKLDYKNWNN